MCIHPYIVDCGKILCIYHGIVVVESRLHEWCVKSSSLYEYDNTISLKT